MATLRLTTGDELLEALAADQAVIRLKVAHAISRRPDLVDAYGPMAAQAIADFLWARLRLEPEPAVRSGVLGALKKLDDPWVVPECARILGMPEHKLALEAAAVLHGRDLSNQPPTLRVRAAILAQDRNSTEDLLADAFVSAWLRELEGPYAALAFELLAHFSSRVVAWLASHCADLNPVAFAWLVSISGESERKVRLALLQQAIAAPETSVVCAALAVCRECFAELPAPLRQRALDSIDHADAEVRRRSALLPRPTAQLVPIVDREPDSRVRAALLRQLSPLEDDARQRLDNALAHGDWRERAAAVDAFAAAGPAVVDDVRAVYLASGGLQRAAACQVLMRLGEEDWLRTAAQR